MSSASLAGNYSFVLEKIDSNVLFGFPVRTVRGVLSFDGAGNVAAQGTENFNGTVGTFADTGTYKLGPAGDLQVSFPDIAFAVTGSVSFDLGSFIASDAATNAPLSQQILLATKLIAQASSSRPSGNFFVSERGITFSGGSPQVEEDYTGTVTLDGQGNCTVLLTGNRSDLAPVSAATCTAAADGSVQLNLPGRAVPAQVVFAPNGGIGFGATISQQSAGTHDLIVMTRANADGLGNAGLDGSYAVVMSKFSRTGQFSVAAGQVDYTGDGSASYQLVPAGAGAAAGSINVNPGGTLQFSVPGSTGTFQGGLGASGHSLSAVTFNDPSTFNLMIAIRTPSQPAALVNAASFVSAGALSPGALVTIFGRNLGKQVMQASSLPLQTAMAGVSVKIGGVPAPLLYVSAFQVNLQVPFATPPGDVPITIVLDDVESGPLTVAGSIAGPGIFTLSQDGKGAGTFLHGDFSPVNDASPAHPGETILIYCTGLGAVVPPVADGAAGPSDPLANAVPTVSVLIDGKDAGTPSFAGLAPGFTGLYQVNVKVPANVTAPGSVLVMITAGGAQSNTVTLPVAP